MLKPKLHNGCVMFDNFTKRDREKLHNYFKIEDQPPVLENRIFEIYLEFIIAQTHRAREERMMHPRPLTGERSH